MRKQILLTLVALTFFSCTPSRKELDILINSSLQTHFSENDTKKIDVSHKLLRDSPTKVGLADPKYYLWVDIKDKKNQLTSSGAVRVAMVNSKEVYITHYISKEEIKTNPKSLDRIFPSDLRKIIINEANKLN